MNTRSVSPGALSAGADTGRTLVWDLPVRVFHWLTVFSVLGAWLTADSDDWRQVHVALGYTVAGLVAFRLVWGLVGTRHARFTSFVRGPRAAWTHIADLLRGRFGSHAGHNPAGALGIVVMLALLVAVPLTGWVTYREVMGEWTEDVHEVLGNLLLIMAGVHVAAVLLTGWLGHDNLVTGMITGRKRVAPHEGIGRAWRGLGILMLIAVLGFWAVRWQNAPEYAAQARQTQAEHEDDDD